jgi:hypothetical protein
VVPLSVFQPGQNHIAVELHQISPASTDAVFGLTLISHTDITDPAIHGAGRLLDGLRVSEIMYHPEADEDLEFIELANVSDQVIDLSNVRIRGGVTFDFSEIQLAPDQRTVVVRDRIRFEQTYGPSISIAGQYAGNLSNRSDSIRLLLPLAFGGAIVDFSYHDHWYPSTDGDGRSLVARDLRAPRQVWRNASQWEASNLIGGSPGRPESTVSPDFDGDGRVDIRDVELLCSEIRGGEHNQALDLNGDAIVDNADMAEMITQFIGTRTGDANLDGHVDALDLNQVGKHWLQASDELTWAKGNFNCDNTVDALDLNQVGMHWQFGATARTPRAPLATRTVIQDNLVDVVMADVAHAVRSQPHIP